MKVEGGCYCGQVRFAIDGDAMFVGQCHCRECQYISGGSPNVVTAVPEAAFTITKGATKGFKRADLENGVTREFCPNCGTHLLTRAPQLAGAVIVKLGVLDNPNAFGNPQMAIFTIDQQPFHTIAAGLPTFERMPG